MYLKLACCLAIVALFPVTAFSQSAPLTITSLSQNQTVAIRQLVRGRAASGIRQIWLVVHPLETDDCWAQGPTIVNSDGTWQIMAQFGEAGSEHAGKPYEVRALANPRRTAAPGRVQCGLDAELYSDPINVVRN